MLDWPKQLPATYRSDMAGLVPAIHVFSADVP
jgi:hypothetical protein